MYMIYLLPFISNQKRDEGRLLVDWIGREENVTQVICVHDRTRPLYYNNLCTDKDRKKDDDMIWIIWNGWICRYPQKQIK